MGAPLNLVTITAKGTARSQTRQKSIAAASADADADAADAEEEMLSTQPTAVGGRAPVVRTHPATGDADADADMETIMNLQTQAYGSPASKTSVALIHPVPVGGEDADGD